MRQLSKMDIRTCFFFFVFFFLDARQTDTDLSRLNPGSPNFSKDFDAQKGKYSNVLEVFDVCLELPSHLVA